MTLSRFPKKVMSIKKAFTKAIKAIQSDDEESRNAAFEKLAQVFNDAYEGFPDEIFKLDPDTIIAILSMENCKIYATSALGIIEYFVEKHKSKVFELLEAIKYDKEEQIELKDSLNVLKLLGKIETFQPILKIEKSSEEISNLKKEIEELKEENNAMAEKYNEAVEKCNKVLEKCERYKEKVKNLKTSKADEKDENHIFNELSEKYAESQIKIKELERNVEEKDNEMAALRIQIDEMSKLVPVDIFQVIDEGDVERFSEIIRHDPSVCEQKQEGETVFSRALRSKNEEIINIMVSGCLKFCDFANDDGRTPLIIAAECGLSSVCETLIGLGADTKAKEKTFGRDALMCAIVCHQIETAICMLNTDKMDVNAKDKDKKTPLMYAAENGEYDLAANLLGYDADKTMKDKSGKKAVDYAKDKKLKNLLKVK